MSSVRPLTRDDLPTALRYLLAFDGGPLATPRVVRGFLEYLESCGGQFVGRIVEADRRLRGAFLGLLLPGRTALAMIAPPGDHGITLDAQFAATRDGLRGLAHPPLHYVQSLIDPVARGRRRILEQVDFRMLTHLLYLERNATYPWINPPDRTDLTWDVYDERTHDHFCQTISETYAGSLDCPELTGTRPPEDILLAHRGGIRFDPALWQLVRFNGQAAGCILLSPMLREPALEVTYMGVTPPFRGRGFGLTLLARALELVRALRLRHLTLAVDERNSPARRLYERVGFKIYARRAAMLFRDGTANEIDVHPRV